MTRRNDNSPYIENWTNRKLIAEIRRIANFEKFGRLKDGKDIGDDIRENTRIYRNSWLNPLIEEIERRLVK